MRRISCILQPYAFSVLRSTDRNLWRAGEEVAEDLEHLLFGLGRLEVLGGGAVAHLDALHPKPQGGRGGNRLSPDHVPKKKNNAIL